ncbi:MAG: hypothetical protein ABI904_18070 [Chloroflexota bacterium]
MPRKLSEERTRKELIDPQLEQAGWYLRDHAKVKTEIPVDGYDAEPWNGVSDYCLYRENGEVLAVVETSSPCVGGWGSPRGRWRGCLRVCYRRALTMDDRLLSTLEYLISAFAGVVARVESLRGRMGESTRQVEGLFESLLSQSFDGGR